MFIYAIYALINLKYEGYPQNLSEAEEIQMFRQRNPSPYINKIM
jgi:hypothetical protein